MRNHFGVQLGLDSGSGDEEDMSVLEINFPISIFGPGRGEYREASVELTGTALPFKSNLRLDSYGTVPGVGSEGKFRDLGNRRKGRGDTSDGGAQAI